MVGFEEQKHHWEAAKKLDSQLYIFRANLPSLPCNLHCRVEEKNGSGRLRDSASVHARFAGSRWLPCEWRSPIDSPLTLQSTLSCLQHFPHRRESDHYGFGMSNLKFKVMYCKYRKGMRVDKERLKLESNKRFFRSAISFLLLTCPLAAKHLTITISQLCSFSIKEVWGACSFFVSKSLKS